MSMYTDSSNSSSYYSSYGTLSNYNNNNASCSQNTRCAARTIIPTFDAPPGYNTGYCNILASKNCNDNFGNLSQYGYQNLKSAYSSACTGGCSSQQVTKLCQ